MWNFIWILVISTHHKNIVKIFENSKDSEEHICLHVSVIVPDDGLAMLWHIVAETKWKPFRRRHFEFNFFNENAWILIKISLKFVPNCPIDNIPSLVYIMAWRRPGDKPLFEPMMVSFTRHICVPRPQWVKWKVNSGYNGNWNWVQDIQFCDIIFHSIFLPNPHTSHPYHTYEVDI